MEGEFNFAARVSYAVSPFAQAAHLARQSSYFYLFYFIPTDKICLVSRILVNKWWITSTNIQDFECRLENYEFQTLNRFLYYGFKCCKMIRWSGLFGTNNHVIGTLWQFLFHEQQVHLLKPIEIWIWFEELLEKVNFSLTWENVYFLEHYVKKLN